MHRFLALLTLLSLSLAICSEASLAQDTNANQQTEANSNAGSDSSSEAQSQDQPADAAADASPNDDAKPADDQNGDEQNADKQDSGNQDAQKQDADQAQPENKQPPKSDKPADTDQPEPGDDAAPSDESEQAKPKMFRIPGKGPAWVEPPTEDANYPLMGEFVGEVTAGEGEPQLLGLQIRPVGGDDFDAIAFLGGLPGQEDHQGEPVHMIGRRNADFVVLSGGPYAIFVEKDGCTLLDRTGTKVGRLDRIERSSPTLGAKPGEHATILFDGNGTEHFTKAEMTEEGLLMQGADVKPMFQDFNLHVEFRLPYMPEASGQSRGNSGLYLQSRYECQVLDSFAQLPVVNGCGALYKFKAPDVNMCLPPLVWQTYDVQFTAPRWAADGSKVRDAHITSWINGVKVQDNVALPNKTGAGKEEEPLLLPIRLQDHGDPVRYRNVWVVDRGLATGEFPVHAE